MSSNEIPVVVVGVDGSPDSTSAVKWAEDYATSIGADLRIVTSWEWPMAYGVPMAFDGYDPAHDAQVIADKARVSVSLAEGRAHVVVAEGQAGPVLVNQTEGAVALVVGSKGHGAVSTLLLGSVSNYCAHHASCPVVVVR